MHLMHLSSCSHHAVEYSSSSSTAIDENLAILSDAPQQTTTAQQVAYLVTKQSLVYQCKVKVRDAFTQEGSNYYRTSVSFGIDRRRTRLTIISTRGLGSSQQQYSAC